MGHAQQRWINGYCVWVISSLQSSISRMIRARSSLRALELRSIGGMTAVDVEDVTGDERGFVGSDVDNSVSHFLGQAETSEGYAFHQARLVFRRTGKASQHARVRRPRTDRIYSDAGLRNFECHRLGHPLDGMLRGNVYGRKRRTLMTIG